MYISSRSFVCVHMNKSRQATTFLENWNSFNKETLKTKQKLICCHSLPIPYTCAYTAHAQRRCQATSKEHQVLPFRKEKVAY